MHPEKNKGQRFGFTCYCKIICSENGLLCCSSFPNDVLRSLSDHVVSQSVDCILPNLTHHLKLLSLAMRATDIPPAVSDLMAWFSDFFIHLSGQVFI